MLRYWGWSRLTAQVPACTRTPQVCLVFLLSSGHPSAADGDLNPNFLLICVQRCGKSVSLKSCCQKKKRSLWRRWRAMGRQLLKRSKCVVVPVTWLGFHQWLISHQVDISILLVVITFSNVLITYSEVGEPTDPATFSWLEGGFQVSWISLGSSHGSCGWATWGH